jgi:hypothetical protein
MKKPLFSFLAALLLHMGNSRAQVPPSRDSLFYVHLRNGATLYSRQVQLMGSKIKYLRLAGGPMIPLDSVLDYRSWDGIFAVGLYRGGPQVYKRETKCLISLYSQYNYATTTTWSAPDVNGVSWPQFDTEKEKTWYFRKGEEGPLLPYNYSNLRSAVADNPASAAQIRIASRNRNLGIGFLAGGGALILVALAEATHRRPDGSLSQSATNTSLILSGASVGLSLGSFPFILSVPKHTRKALDIYNGN